MEHIDISREIQTIRILLPQKTTEFEKDALVFTKIFKRINKYNEVLISRFDEINKMTKNVYNISSSNEDLDLLLDEQNLSRQTNNDDNSNNSNNNSNNNNDNNDDNDDNSQNNQNNVYPNEYQKKIIIDDIHIHVGDIVSDWFKHSNKKFYLMDHENFKPKILNEIGKVDGVLCRTKIDLELIKKIKNENNFDFKIYNTRFTSVFQEKPVLKHWNVVLHFAGEYHRKQTSEILKTWQTYPDLPLIIIICTDQCFKNVEDLLETNGRPKNIHFHKRKLENEDLTLIANKMGIHLCPSEIEGYGHTINDARKIKSLIITSNIEPINELVDDSCAIMINCTTQSNIKLHKNSKYNSDVCFISKEYIYEAVMKAIKMNIDDRKKMTDIAYEKYLEDTYFFEMAIMDLLNDSKPNY